MFTWLSIQQSPCTTVLLPDIRQNCHIVTLHLHLQYDIVSTLTIFCGGRRVGFSITNHDRWKYPPESNDVLNNSKVRWVKHVEKTCCVVVISPPRLMFGTMALREILFQPYCVWTGSICMNNSQMIACIEKYFLLLCHVLIKQMKVNLRHTKRVTVAEIKTGLWQNDWDIIWETYWE